MKKLEDVNPNKYVRKWKIQYRKSKWQPGDIEEIEITGDFNDVLKKLKEIGSQDIYTDFYITEME